MVYSIIPMHYSVYRSVLVFCTFERFQKNVNNDGSMIVLRFQQRTFVQYLRRLAVLIVDI